MSSKNKVFQNLKTGIIIQRELNKQAYSLHNTEI